MLTSPFLFFFFFFNDTATTEIYTLSLHDALPISPKAADAIAIAAAIHQRCFDAPVAAAGDCCTAQTRLVFRSRARSEEHTSELQSQSNLVCRLLLEKKKKKNTLTERIIES